MVRHLDCGLKSQSVLVVHGTQVFDEHTGAVFEVQSVEVRQGTQVFEDVRHFGVGALH